MRKIQSQSSFPPRDLIFRRREKKGQWRERDLCDVNSMLGSALRNESQNCSLIVDLPCMVEEFPRIPALLEEALLVLAGRACGWL